MALPRSDAGAGFDALAGLHPLLDDSASLDEALGQVALAVRRSVPAIAAVGVTVDDASEGFRTAAMVGEPAQPLDDAQYEADDGPCLSAHRRGEVVAVAEIERNEKWPAFRTAALGLGYRSSISLPLAVGDTRMGALNLYSRRARPFDDAELALAAAIAHEGSVAAANAMAFHRQQRLIAQMDEAIGSRDVIGQAKGILMAQRAISADEAFDLLVQRSQQLNTKLRDVAVWVASTGSLDDLQP